MPVKILCYMTDHKWFPTVGVERFVENRQQSATVELCVFRERLCTRCGAQEEQYIDTLWSWDPMDRGGPSFQALAKDRNAFGPVYFPLGERGGW